MYHQNEKNIVEEEKKSHGVDYRNYTIVYNGSLGSSAYTEQNWDSE